ncbi:hypothetical protein Lal_00040181 [Lupinus albus]|nr:hypothetical protein Lal_00040181 [Lupinus albus]
MLDAKMLTRDRNVQSDQRSIEASLRRVHRVKVSPIRRGRRRPRKTVGETIRKDLEINFLSMNMIYDKTL